MKLRSSPGMSLESPARRRQTTLLALAACTLGCSSSRDGAASAKPSATIAAPCDTASITSSVAGCEAGSKRCCEAIAGTADADQIALACRHGVDRACEGLLEIERPIRWKIDSLSGACETNNAIWCEMLAVARLLENPRDIAGAATSLCARMKDGVIHIGDGIRCDALPATLQGEAATFVESTRAGTPGFNTTSRINNLARAAVVQRWRAHGFGEDDIQEILRLRLTRPVPPVEGSPSGGARVEAKWVADAAEAKDVAAAVQMLEPRLKQCIGHAKPEIPQGPQRYLALVGTSGEVAIVVGPGMVEADGMKARHFEYDHTYAALETCVRATLEDARITGPSSKPRYVHVLIRFSP